jgi:uncharacterized protein
MSKQIVVNRRIQTLVFAALIGLGAAGCSTYKDQNRVIVYWRQNNLTNAVVEATKMAEKKVKGKDAIIWRLEQGSVLRGNGQYQESNVAFDKAQARIDQYSQEAKVKVANEAGALLSNQANLPYVGRTYDGIMLNTYKALNYLQLGEPDKARVELTRAYQRQQDAVEENKKRIEKAQKAAAKTKDSKSISKAENDPKLKAKMNGAYAGLDTLKAYADYVNPFTVYLDGLFFMANAADASDLERAHKSLERVVGYNPDNPYVKRDLAALDGVMQGRPLAPTTYVIFETGCAPIRDQIRIDIPTFIPKSPYAGAAFPTLKPQGNYLQGLRVTANSPLIPVSAVATTTSSPAAAPVAGDPPASAVSTATNATTLAAGDPNASTNTITAATTTTNETPATAGDTNAPASAAAATPATATAGVPTKAPATADDSIAGCTSLNTSPIASMDSVIGLDFKNELPIIITKTIASTITKAIAAYAINEAASQQGNSEGAAIIQLVALISTVIYQASVNIADLRTWTTLPKEFQVCSFPTPADRNIVLELPVGVKKIPVTIGDGTINIVYVKSITAATNQLLVTQIKLK